MASRNDNNIKIFFKYNQQVIQLPVNPEEITFVREGNNSSQEVVTLGEINKLKDVKLTKTSIESFFPISEYPSYVLTSGKDFLSPEALIKFFEEPQKNKEPLLLTISGLPASSEGLTKQVSLKEQSLLSKAGSFLADKVQSLFGDSEIVKKMPFITLYTRSFNKMVSIEHFETNYKSDFDVNFKLELKEYKDYGAKCFGKILGYNEEGVADVEVPAPTRQADSSCVALKVARIANRAVRTVNRYANMANKAVNEARSAGTFIKTVQKGL